ncbi:MAG: DUF488 domain-containing protein [Euryarchaeota archaeon]|nr:DUF488 domain-containing protein [Euryarchaeota archaeon]
MQSGSRCYTIGYSNRTFEDFVDVLKNSNITHLIDIRRYPHSYYEDFNKESLELSLPINEIAYYHCPGLGGFRDGAYTEYMGSEEFKNNFFRLLDKIRDINDSGSNIILMCAEKNPKNCHRYHLSKELERNGVEVVHLTEPGQTPLSLY